MRACHGEAALLTIAGGNLRRVRHEPDQAERTARRLPRRRAGRRLRAGQRVTLCGIASGEELRDARQLLSVCSEFIQALRVKQAAAIGADVDAVQKRRQLELHCYVSHFALEDVHLLSALYP